MLSSKKGNIISSTMYYYFTFMVKKIAIILKLSYPPKKGGCLDLLKRTHLLVCHFDSFGCKNIKSFVFKVSLCFINLSVKFIIGQRYKSSRSDIEEVGNVKSPTHNVPFFLHFSIIYMSNFSAIEFFCFQTIDVFK